MFNVSSLRRKKGSNEIKNLEDIEKFKEECGVTSAMVARAAMWNCSVFSKKGRADLDIVIKRFLEIVGKDIFQLNKLIF